jgi:autotransporter-associated beta strand protein
LSNTSNNWTGGLTLKGGSNTQTLKLGNSGVITDSLSVNFATTGTILDMNGKSETVNLLSSTGGFGIVQNQLASTVSTLTLGGGASSSATFSGVIRNNSGSGGTVALAKIGNGTQVLSGLNTYTGGTTVTGGTLTFANSFTMSGANAITVAATGAAGTNYATITSSAGTLTFGGTLGVTITTSLSGGESFSLFQANGGALAGNFSSVSIAGTYTAAMTYDAGTSTWIGSDLTNNLDFVLSSTSGILSVSAIPEPSTYAAIFGALALAGTAVYRRRQARK